MNRRGIYFFRVMVKRVFKDIFTQNIVLKLIALAFTLLLWFGVNATRNVEMVKKMPLNFITSPDLIVSNDISKEVDIKLIGPRVFLREVIERSDVINIDLRDKKPGYVLYKLYEDVIKLPIGVKVVSIYPSDISPKLERLKSKKVSVIPSLTGELPDGYKIKQSSIEPKEVEISGPESFINKIGEIYTEPVDVSGLTESITRGVAMDSRYKGKFKNISADKYSLYLDVTALITTRKFHRIDVKTFGVKRFKINPNNVTVIIEGTKKLIEKLTAKDIVVTLDLSFNAPGNYSEELAVRLPKGVNLISVIPRKVSVWIY